MIEFAITCRRCGKLITLRVRDESQRRFFEDAGALCQTCYEPLRRPVPVSCAA